MKTETVKLSTQDVGRLWHTGCAGCFVHAQEGRFEYIDCDSTDIFDSTEQLEGNNIEASKVFMLWTVRYLEATIIRNYYRDDSRPAFILWDMDLEEYCVWVGTYGESV